MPGTTIKTRTSGIMVPAFVAPTTTPFQGVGDVIATTAYAWWGTRAYKLSAIGQNAVDLKFLDATIITYATIAGGGLDVAQINADAVTHGTPIEVSKLYDQTGNGRHLTDATFVRPKFQTSGSGLTVPNMFVIGTNTCNNTTAFGTAAQPATYGGVFRHNTGTAQVLALAVFNAGNFSTIGIYRTTSDNTVAAGSAGTPTPDIALTDGTWAAIQCTFTNSVNDRQGVNGFQQTGTNAGVNTIDINCQLPFNGGGVTYDMVYTEAGVWTIEFTGTQMTSVYQNQKAYYGLP